ncbi:hypothetical protein D3A96_05975 [Robertkochia marina]|nr:hypothetical protein D3A96_05975 [Robertkochia marina]
MIRYSMGDVVITRVDECDKSSFYYGEKSSNESGVIWVEYSGLNDGFKGYLKCQENGKVILFSGDGYFKTQNLDTTKLEYKYILAHERPKVGGNVCYINAATNYEKEDNVLAGSEVKVQY